MSTSVIFSSVQKFEMILAKFMFEFCPSISLPLCHLLRSQWPNGRKSPKNLRLNQVEHIFSAGSPVRPVEENFLVEFQYPGRKLGQCGFSGLFLQEKLSCVNSDAGALSFTAVHFMNNFEVYEEGGSVWSQLCQKVFKMHIQMWVWQVAIRVYTGARHLREPGSRVPGDSARVPADSDAIGTQAGLHHIEFSLNCMSNF